MDCRRPTVSQISAGLILSLTLVLYGCDSADGPAPVSADLPALSKGAHPVQTTGGGQYALTLLGETFPGTITFSAMQSGSESAKGRFRVTLDLGDGIPGVLEGGTLDFKGEVTCVSDDVANGRAWIGGIVTQNRSTQPFYRDAETTQVGKDIWFRVLDVGEGTDLPDRTTTAGFEGDGGIITSQEYCDAQIWPDGNARTHPITQGNVQVHQ